MSEAGLDAALQQAGIGVELDAEVRSRLVEGLATESFTCEALPIAHGRPLVPAQDAWLELSFAPGIQAGHVREDGTVDYHDRELLKTVEHGELLAELHPALPGVTGRRVTGEVLRPDAPRELSIRLLPGVERGRDDRVRATRSGVVLYVPDKSLDVVDHHVHEGPVDMHSGDLMMQGSLVVRGDVLHPFRVIASGDLDISGSVDAATVIAGGRLRIQRGVRGAEGACVHAAADLSVHHAQYAELRCGGRLTVTEAVNSHMVAKEIEITGRVRGGLVEAESHLLVHEAGTPHGTETLLVVGNPVEVASAEASVLLSEERGRGRSADSGAQRPPASRDAAPRSLRGGRHEMRPEPSHSSVRGRPLSVLQELAQAASHQAGPESRRELTHEAAVEETQRQLQWEARRDELLQSATVELGLAHRGVTLRMGSAHLTLEETVRAVRFRFDRETGQLVPEKLEG